MGIFSGNRSKIDTTVEGVDSPARPPIIQKYVNDRLNLSIGSTDFEKYYLSRVGLNMFELTTH